MTINTSKTWAVIIACAVATGTIGFMPNTANASETTQNKQYVKVKTAIASLDKTLKKNVTLSEGSASKFLSKKDRAILKKARVKATQQRNKIAKRVTHTASASQLTVAFKNITSVHNTLKKSTKKQRSTYTQRAKEYNEVTIALEVFDAALDNVDRILNDSRYPKLSSSKKKAYAKDVKKAKNERSKALKSVKYTNVSTMRKAALRIEIATNTLNAKTQSMPKELYKVSPIDDYEGQKAWSTVVNDVLLSYKSVNGWTRDAVLKDVRKRGGKSVVEHQRKNSKNKVTYRAKLVKGKWVKVK